MKKALVTGGTGFIGSNLVLELETLGFEVTALDTQVETEFNLQGFKGEFIQVDLSRPFKLDKNFDIIFHQAAITDPRFHDDTELWRANIDGFFQILELAKSQQAKLVYASTAGLYGNGTIPMREDQPKECLTVYGSSKLKMDEIAEQWMKQIPIVGLRYFNVFGPKEAHKGRPASMIYHLYQQMRRGERPRLFEFGEQCRDQIYVKDVVRANICAVDAPSGIYNVGTGRGTSFNELVMILNKVLGTQLEPIYFPMPYDSKTYQHSTVADPNLAKERLRFESQWSLEEAIADYLEFLSSNC